jgi:FkbM family methyltransferase
MGHAVRALRNAFFSPGRRLFGLRFSRDYLLFAWRAARNWGYGGPGVLELLGYRLEYFNQSDALFLVHEIFVNAAYAFESADPRPRIVDCGANIGMAVIFFKALRPDAEVIAFEPDPTTFGRLVRTVELNRFRNVQLENAAVGDQDGTVTFYTDASGSGGMTASIERPLGGETRREVRSVRLSTWIQAPVDLLKLDVEGAEYDVVRDLIDTDAIRWIREAVIEHHAMARLPDGASQMIKALEAAGFVVVRVSAPDPESTVGLIRARRVNQPPA